jgi:hypothetical protein
MLSRAMELETAKEILAEVFHARPGEVEELIQSRLEEKSWPEEPQHVMYECERQKYFMRPIVHTKIDRYEKLECADGSNLAADCDGFRHAIGFGKRRIYGLGK